ncbi:DUF1045 domain-containing protein [Variibacter gotjawalensis]|uniref:DUF1045 domain-containing protein n=1 Tax=Variibacter gotjawalensis TaxID=1333996 RepID=UPI001D7BB309|nr:DUF1045 domain-containing protein [Variibacter gotjawalensis]NIK49422.1 hypothetical protein [Variibacter gotjawalensis]
MTEAAATATQDPRRYGFHATLKAPMRLDVGRTQAELQEALRRFASTRPAVDIGKLDVTLIGGFVALTPRTSSVALQIFAAECVATFDQFRVQMSTEERAKRIGNGMSARQTALLDRWGYPYVFDEFRFHMTLTGSLPRDIREAWQRELSVRYEVIGHEPVMLDAVTLLRQDASDARFHVIERIALID